jgi:hypothetical protein
LLESFGDRWTTFEVSDVHGPFGPQSLESFLTKRPGIQAISSRIEKRFLRLSGSIPIVMLRHPIDRARSVFKFLQRDVSQRYHAFARGSLAEYVSWELEVPTAARTSGIIRSIIYPMLRLDQTMPSEPPPAGISTSSRLSPGLSGVRAGERVRSLVQTVRSQVSRSFPIALVFFRQAEYVAA